jgi:phage terminase large subunit-like protein
MPNKETRADRVIRFIESYCVVPTGTLQGRLMALLPFQKDFIRDVYREGVREGILCLGRKNGKSSLTACILLAHIVGPEKRRNDSIILGANTAKQALILFDQCAQILAMSPKLHRLAAVRRHEKRIIGLKENVALEVLAADSAAAQGYGARVVVVDEIGEIESPTSRFVDALRMGQGNHADPLMLCLSTQARSDQDLLSIMLDEYTANPTPSRVVHWHYAKDIDCGLFDEEAWKEANPALGVFRNIDDVRALAQRAADTRNEAEFRQRVLNQRVRAEGGIIGLDVWRNMAVPQPDMSWQDYDYVVLAVDLAMGGADFCAMVALCLHAGKWIAIPVFYMPEDSMSAREDTDKIPYSQFAKNDHIVLTEGKGTDFSRVAHDIANIQKSAREFSLVFDPAYGGFLKEEMVKQGHAGIWEAAAQFKQTAVSYGPAIAAFNKMVVAGTLQHIGNPLLTGHVLNAVIKGVEPNIRVTKPSRNKRIDGAACLMMACGIAANTTVAEMTPMVF